MDLRLSTALRALHSFCVVRGGQRKIFQEKHVLVCLQHFLHDDYRCTDISTKKVLLSALDAKMLDLGYRYSP